MGLFLWSIYSGMGKKIKKKSFLMLVNAVKNTKLDDLID